MLKYRDNRLTRVGVIGAVLCVLIVAIGLAPERLVSMATALQYRAIFAEAGGLALGNDVTVAGMKVGAVSDISLRHGEVVVGFTVAGTVRLGSETTAHIATGSVLGQRMVVLRPAGRDPMRHTDEIPLSRTSSPYSLTEAMDELTTNAEGLDTASLNQSLDALSDAIDRISPQLTPTFDGLTRLSRTLNERNESMRDLLKHAGNVSEILADRSQQVDTLILDTNDLLAVLVQRRNEIATLLANTTAVARQLSGLVADHEQELGPTLDRLNSVAAMLQQNRDNIAKALPGFAKYQLTLGETVANGPYYNAFVPNLLPGQMLQPFLDYAFGFRRGVDAGQPPDDAGPRAEFPWPRNGIPERPR
ncbi:MCE family protein [Mycobacterium sp. 29Ha]|uniref:MCE family protein n=1 Tax=Mycobacterium sp. 29Ha TaxID=2939268 RepID=UPI0029391BC9|nr:MCE family protein [Mycobacterium sp. 29Ha]MDV3136123.1 MCE family protein [Mycobacterium sp. 29Ha]